MRGWRGGMPPDEELLLGRGSADRSGMTRPSGGKAWEPTRTWVQDWGKKNGEEKMGVSGVSGGGTTGHVCGTLGGGR